MYINKEQNFYVTHILVKILKPYQKILKHSEASYEITLSMLLLIIVLCSSNDY